MWNYITLETYSSISFLLEIMLFFSEEVVPVLDRIFLTDYFENDFPEEANPEIQR